MSESNPAAGDRFQFTGRELDDATGFQYHRARYYDAALGRWTQQDPIGFNAGDANLYRYVGNGPTNHIDPLGWVRDDPAIWQAEYWEGFPPAVQNLAEFSNPVAPVLGAFGVPGYSPPSEFLQTQLETANGLVDIAVDLGMQGTRLELLEPTGWLPAALTDPECRDFSRDVFATRPAAEHGWTKSLGAQATLAALSGGLSKLGLGGRSAVGKLANKADECRVALTSNSTVRASTSISGKGLGGNQVVDRVAGEIQGAVNQADRVLRTGGTGGTRWGTIYQHYRGTGHWLEPVARGNALQQIAETRLINNTYLEEAGVIFRRSHVFGVRNKAGNLLFPDFQVPLSNGRVGVIDITTPGQAPKIFKYGVPGNPQQVPQLINVTY